MLQEPVDAFSAIVHKDKAYAYGVTMTAKLRELIPRQQFEVPVQAAIGTRVIARETIRAVQGCAGQVLRRGHHPEAQVARETEEGKKRMKMVGRVEVPPEAFVAALSGASEAAKTDRK